MGFKKGERPPIDSGGYGYIGTFGLRLSRNIIAELDSLGTRGTRQWDDYTDTDAEQFHVACWPPIDSSQILPVIARAKKKLRAEVRRDFWSSE